MNPFISLSTPTAGQATTASYVDVTFVDPASGHETALIRATTSGPVSFHLVNTGANSLDYRVLGSNDPSLADNLWSIEIATAPLSSNAAQGEYLDIGRFLFYKLQVKDTTPSSTGTMVATVVAKRY